jgi:two-component system chemotaxis response regulator CheY
MDVSKEVQFLEIDQVKVPKDIGFLIVEDEEDISELMKDTLLEMGFTGQVTVAESVEKAIELSHLVNVSYDFIISDWNLLGLSGLDLLISLKSENRYKNTPFLMVTANDNVSGMIVAMKKGASDYLVKPWTMEELQSKIAISWSKRLPTLPL